MPTIPPPDPINPLSSFTNDELDNVQVSMALICGRNRAILKGKRRTLLCSFQQILNFEQTNRGRPAPSPPYSA